MVSQPGILRRNVPIVSTPSVVARDIRRVVCRLGVERFPICRIRKVCAGFRGAVRPLPVYVHVRPL